MRIDTVNLFDVHRWPCALRATKARISHVCVISQASGAACAIPCGGSARIASSSPPLPARAVASMMNAEEIPNWVPASVKKLAVQFGFADELVRRLVTDPKMKNVWQYLLRRAQPMDSEIAHFGAALEFWRVSEMGVSVQEQACAFFFWYAVIEMCAPMAATTRQDIENSVAPWRFTAEQCRSAIGSLSSSANRELVKALSLTAEYFEFRAQDAEKDANSPYTLKRRSGKPEDNTVRGQVRALALISRAIWLVPIRDSRERGHGCAANQRNRKSVRNWCSDLRVAAEDSTAR